MKIAKKQNKFPKKIIIAVLAILVVGGVGAFGLYQSQKANNVADTTPEAVRPVNDVDYSAPTTDEQKQQDQRKEEIIKQNEQTPPTDSSINVTIVRATQSAAGAPVNIRTIINGSTSGTCEVVLKKDGQTVTKTFQIVLQATTSTCDQADIPAADFPSAGEWSLSITAKGSNATSNPATGSVKVIK